MSNKVYIPWPRFRVYLERLRDRKGWALYIQLRHRLDLLIKSGEIEVQSQGPDARINRDDLRRTKLWPS